MDLWLRVATTNHYFLDGEREAICRTGIRRINAIKGSSPNYCRVCKINKHNREGHPTIMVLRFSKIVEVPRDSAVALLPTSR